MNKYNNKDQTKYHPASIFSSARRMFGVGFDIIILALFAVAVVYLLKLYKPLQKPDEKALAKLIVSLHSDEDVFSRAAAARALGKTGNLNVVPDLVSAYKEDENNEIHTEIINALIEFGITRDDFIKLLGKQSIYEKIIVEIQSIDFTKYLIISLVMGTVVGIFAFIIQITVRRNAGLFSGPKLGIVTAAMATTISFVLWVYFVPQTPREINLDEGTLLNIQVDLAKATKDNDYIPLLLDIIDDTTQPIDLKINAIQALGAMKDLGRWESQVFTKLSNLDTRLIDNEEYKLSVIWALGNLIAEPSKRDDNFEYKKFITGVVNEYDVALSYDPNAPYILLKRGVLNLSVNNNEDAIYDFSEALNQQPAFPEALYQRGLAYTHINSYTNAISDFSSAITYGMDNSDIFCARGNAWFLLGEYQNSIDDFTQCIERDRNRADAYRTIGMAYRLEKKYSEALNAFEAYLNLVPNATDKSQIDQWINELHNNIDMGN